MQYGIAGILNQVVSFDLEPGERLWAAKNALMSFTEGVDWSPRIPGGPLKIVSRRLSGESVFLLKVVAEARGRLQLACHRPSLIYDWDLTKGPVTTLKHNFLAAVGDVSIDVNIARNPLAALFGGAGLLLQTISGTGRAFISVQGDLIDYDLAAGQSILVSTGNLAAFATTVDYSIKGVGGCFKMIFGGEGIFMTRMEGPGKVLVQNIKREPKTVKGIFKLLEMIPS